MKPKTKFMIGGLLVLGTAGWLMVTSIKETGEYYMTPSELSTKLKVDPTVSVQWITTAMQITNNGTMAVPLSDLTVRYWYTFDTLPDGGTPVAQASMCNYTFTPPGACGNVTFATWVRVMPAKMNADYYSQIGFMAAAGNLNPGATAEFQVQFHKNDWTFFTQNTDYSFNGLNAFTATTKVTVYRVGTLVYGTEPP